jgi:hypothetical protein
MYAPMSRFSLPFSMNPSRRTPVVLALCAGMFCVPNVSLTRFNAEERLTSKKRPTPLDHLSGSLRPSDGLLGRGNWRIEDDELLWTIKWRSDSSSSKEDGGKESAEEHVEKLII